jgi:hypothetical protein
MYNNDKQEEALLWLMARLIFYLLLALAGIVLGLCVTFSGCGRHMPYKPPQHAKELLQGRPAQPLEE